MIKVITYGTYDLLHEGHLRLLKRARALGDYLIVGVTSDDFDKVRGKINVQQSLSERIEAVRATGLADQIIVEEYEGQKIDDIIEYGVSIFTVGSDWVGKFDYLKEYCEVIYLPRTEGISSSTIRSSINSLKVGIVGESHVVLKVIHEGFYVNGLEFSAILTTNSEIMNKYPDLIVDSYDLLLEKCEAVFILSHPSLHFDQIKRAINAKKHVLVESPALLSVEACRNLKELANLNKVVFMEAIKTSHSTAFNRMVLLVKTGKIGKIVSIEATCTSLRDNEKISRKELDGIWCSIFAWLPIALLPVYRIFGSNCLRKRIISCRILDDFDVFSSVSIEYNNAIASLKVGKSVKSEGDLVISGTDGFIYVPSPWWITSYFEIRYENASNNKRYFYSLEGEGIREELSHFVNYIRKGSNTVIDGELMEWISGFMEDYLNRVDCSDLKLE